MPSTDFSIEEQELELEEQDRERAASRRFDEGFAEYLHRRHEEHLDEIEEREPDAKH